MNEIAFGYKFTSHLYGTVNLYDIRIKDPIVYRYDYENDEEHYFNDSKTGSSGLELELKTLYRRWTAAVSYSYYNAARHNEASIYHVVLPTGQISSVMKGASAHIVHFTGNYSINNRYSVNSAITWYSKRYGFITLLNEQVAAKPNCVADVTLNVQEFLLENLHASISVLNLLNASYGYVQPLGTNGFAEAPIPGKLLELLIKIGYRF